MHVLVIPRSLYDVALVPHMGLFESHQVAALQTAGLQVGVLSGGVITSRYLGRRFPYLSKEFADGVPVYRAYRRAYLPARWEDPIRSARRSYRRVRPLLDDYVSRYGRPDVVHAHNLVSGGLLARHISSDIGVPYVVTEHSGAYVACPEAAARDVRVLVAAAEGARAVVAVGTGLAASLETALKSRIPLKVQVIPNVVDPKFFAAPLRSAHGPYTVLGVGNLIPSKNFRLLIEAFARADLPSDAQLTLCGGGPERRGLVRLAGSRGVSPRVHLTGATSHREVAELMRSADLLAHPSNSESFGVVLIEAMAVGVPILATASSGPSDIVTKEFGCLTPVGDVDAFARGLSDMYRHRSDFDPQRTREACRLRFGPEAFAARMLRVYQEATA